MGLKCTVIDMLIWIALECIEYLRPKGSKGHILRQVHFLHTLDGEDSSGFNEEILRDMWKCWIIITCVHLFNLFDELIEFV